MFQQPGKLVNIENIEKIYNSLNVDLYTDN